MRYVPKRFSLLLLAAVLFCGLALIPGTTAAILPPEGARGEQADPSRPQLLNTTDTGAVRLDEAELRLCEKREVRIQLLIRESVARAGRHADTFTAISKRVQAFYADKGELVATYDRLVAAAAAKKRAVESSLKAVQAATFACDSDGPKRQLAAFRAAHQQVLRDLKAYRQSVRDLTVAVKTALAAARRDANE